MIAAVLSVDRLLCGYRLFAANAGAVPVIEATALIAHRGPRHDLSAFHLRRFGGAPHTRLSS